MFVSDEITRNAKTTQIAIKACSSPDQEELKYQKCQRSFKISDMSKKLSEPSAW